MTIDPPFLVGLPTRLRLVEPVGVGRSAAVWRARDTRDGRDVAVKVLPPPSGGDDRTLDLHRARFEREGRALARLHGVDGVVGLHELGLTPDGTAWLVMDLAASGSLRDRLDRGVSVDVERVGPALACALARAHALGVVHGDLSPSNVVFDERGTPLLTDFGMAALLGGGSDADGVAGCTPAYAAPERLAGGAPDRASDVYALAATLWHAAHGAPPAASDAPGTGALAPRPEDRPTAADYARELGAAPGQLPGATGGTGAGTGGPVRGRRPFRRQR